MNSVLPEMGYRMGIKLYDRNVEPLSRKGASVRDQSIPDADWQAILDYYNRNAPDTLPPIEGGIAAPLKQFATMHYRLPVNSSPLTTLLHADPDSKTLYIGNRYSRIYSVDFTLNLLDSIQLSSPPAHAHTESNSQFFLLMGIMDPNDERLGQLIKLDSTKKSIVLIDSLRRPVHFQFQDFNNDNIEDVVICSFGNNFGELTVFEKSLGTGYLPHAILKQPGARRSQVCDFNNDSLPDLVVLMSQADEQIIYLENLGNFKFKKQTLLRFPPSFGSSYFEMHDFNSDGHLDILYVNGDNADYSPITKPYHGIRIYSNDGENNFDEQWFFPMPGASQAIACDFDLDGDLDIASIAFFADYNTFPEKSFLYLENTDSGFNPYYSDQALAGRWMVMEKADIDADGDVDLLLGSMLLPGRFPDSVSEHWIKNQTSLLVLLNNKILHQDTALKTGPQK